jgi:iron complex outermembrane receptor protein
MAKRLSGMFGLQFTYHKYSIDNSQFTPYDFDVEYKFLTSRLGFNYNITDNLRTFFNISIARREPRLSEIYDGSVIGARPNLRVADTIKGIYKDPLITYEEMNDYEIGIGYAGRLLKANLNFYLMDYTNEIVSNGQLDNFGQPMTWNAGKSVHRGIELEAEYDMLYKKGFGSGDKNPMLTLSGNLSLSDNYFKKYIEKTFIDTNGVVYGNDYSGNKILLNPGIIGNLSVNYMPASGVYAYLTAQYIGQQYLDNSENEKKNPERRQVKGYTDKIINPYTVFNAGVSVDLIPLLMKDKNSGYFRSIEASLKINNIFDKKYEATGGIDTDGSPLWIPAAERNIFMNLRIGF